MSYFYSYPYGGAMPNPADPYWRYQQANPMGGNFTTVNPSTVEPPFPSGAHITSQTPTEPGQVPSNMTNSGSGLSFGGFEVPVGNALTLAQGGSYVSNILRLNRGKLATIYMTFSGNDAATARRTFVGIIEAAGRDHIIISDPNTGHRYVLLTVYLDYVEFPEEINYYYPLDNTINVVDPDLFEKFPTLGALYNYQKQQDELYKQKYPYYDQLPENLTHHTQQSGMYPTQGQGQYHNQSQGQQMPYSNNNDQF
ncbi:spore coat protein GerQ [Turicibacter sp. TJ11]|uniref:spore coat protein GerQ n=1 Tax=Turicibacter sp. TJ11 TaxID=2806443 RepID=UPI001F403E58|nr:spore coat protein GerQ [Turicibacter sp. TJ11]